MKTAVVDDDQVFLDKMKSELTKINIFDNQIDLFSKVQFLEPVISEYLIFFLDIDMPEMNGIELANKIREKSIDAIIIFVSSHANLVFTSMSVNPFQFIRKANFDNDFHQTIIALKKLIEKKYKVIKIMSNQTLRELSIEEIEYVYTFRNYLEIHLIDSNNLTIRETLRGFELLVKENDFVKINRSVLVNIRHIKELYGDHIILDNGDKLEIAKTKISIVKEIYNNYIMAKIL